MVHVLWGWQAELKNLDRKKNAKKEFGFICHCRGIRFSYCKTVGEFCGGSFDRISFDEKRNEDSYRYIIATYSIKSCVELKIVIHWNYVHIKLHNFTTKQITNKFSAKSKFSRLIKCYIYRIKIWKQWFLFYCNKTRRWWDTKVVLLSIILEWKQSIVK